MIFLSRSSCSVIVLSLVVSTHYVITINILFVQLCDGDVWFTPQLMICLAGKSQFVWTHCSCYLYRKDKCNWLWLPFISNFKIPLECFAMLTNFHRRFLPPLCLVSIWEQFIKCSWELLFKCSRHEQYTWLGLSHIHKIKFHNRAWCLNWSSTGLRDKVLLSPIMFSLR